MPCSPSQFIEHYFGALAEHGIPAVIIHGYESLNGPSNSDIDYSVPSDALARIPEIGAKLARKHGWASTLPICSNLFAAYQVFFRTDRPEEFVQMDACTDFVHSGCFLVSAGELHAGSVKCGVFRHSGPAAEFAYHLGKNLAKGRSIGRVLPRLRELAALDTAGCQSAFLRLLGTESGELREWLGREAEKWDEMAGVLRKRRSFGLWHKVQETLRLLRRWCFPHGLHVVVLGPDGAGKSTLISAMTCAMKPFFRGVDYIHSRPCVLDPKPPGGPVSEPHAQKPRSWTGCVAKAFYYLFDHWLGQLVRVRPALVRNRVVIFDRDFHDVIVDPTRYRMKGVGWLARALAWLLPRADIVFVLDAPPELIHARKPELTIPELARQSAVLRQLSETRRNWQLVDASQSPEAVARETIAAVLEKIRFRQ
jgi:thymidylate kinase